MHGKLFRVPGNGQVWQANVRCVKFDSGIVTGICGMTVRARHTVQSHGLCAGPVGDIPIEEIDSTESASDSDDDMMMDLEEILDSDGY